VLTDTIPWKKSYKLLILPDNVVFDDELKSRISAHLKRGGTVISSGECEIREHDFRIAKFAGSNEFRG